MIGDQSNITDSYLEYFVALTIIQEQIPNFGVFIPFKPVHFTNTEDFDEYIASPNYKTGPTFNDTDYPGVCIGLQHFTNKQETGNSGVLSHNYTFSLHFPDKSVSISKFVKSRS